MMHNVIIKDNEYFDLNPVQFGFQNCEKSYFYGPAVRTHWLIHFVVSGCGVFKIRDKTYHIKAGEMFVIPPYEETYYEADSKMPWNYIWIGFTANNGIINYLSDVVVCPEAGEIFHQMKKCSEYDFGRNAYLTARLWDLFVLITDKEEIKCSDYVQKSLDCIHAEYMYDITVEKIAKRLNIDRTYFSVIFKKQIGISPKQYLLQHRMNIAASLLCNNTSVSVVANSVGYTDLYVFSKMFKRHFGISPSGYAKRNYLT